MTTKAEQVLAMMPALPAGDDAIEAAIHAHHGGLDEEAHQLFVGAGDLVWKDPRALYAFAVTKLNLGKKSRKRADPLTQEAGRRLLNDADDLLKRMIQLETDDEARAWAWFHRGVALEWLDAPESEIKGAYSEALDLAPGVTTFVMASQGSERDRQS